jgi:hypothetical protein
MRPFCENKEKEHIPTTICNVDPLKQHLYVKYQKITENISTIRKPDWNLKYFVSTVSKRRTSVEQAPRKL